MLDSLLFLIGVSVAVIRSTMGNCVGVMAKLRPFAETSFSGWVKVLSERCSFLDFSVVRGCSSFFVSVLKFGVGVLIEEEKTYEFVVLYFCGVGTPVPRHELIDFF